MSLELPITPGRYRTRGGQVAEVEWVGRNYVHGKVGKVLGAVWHFSGNRYHGKKSRFDLISRIDDAPNPLIAPLEWALGQLEESLDPDWQAAYKAATEALKLAKQK